MFSKNPKEENANKNNSSNSNSIPINSAGKVGKSHH
jgi:hypothetical protein